jgi:hypothetical protein
MLRLEIPDNFTFIIGDHHCRCRPFVAGLLSPRISKLHWIDATISELKLEVEKRDMLFGSMLKAAILPLIWFIG